MPKTKHKELPAVLVLKRYYIQRFPNGQQVALYHSEAIDQFITVPLDGSQFSNTTESVLEKLYKISEEDIVETINFMDESSLDINKECADILLDYIKDNQEIVEQLSDCDSKFLDVLNIAVNLKQDSLEESTNQQELPINEIIK